MFMSLRDQVDPTIAAISTLLIAISLVAVILFISVERAAERSAARLAPVNNPCLQQLEPCSSKQQTKRTMANSVMAPNAKTTPYWWEGHHLDHASRFAGTPPGKADVVVMGSGFTGLSAALTLARGGRQVVILDSEQRALAAAPATVGRSDRALGHPSPSFRRSTAWRRQPG